MCTTGFITAVGRFNKDYLVHFRQIEEWWTNVQSTVGWYDRPLHFGESVID